jgi:hypothetical protein
LVLFMLGVLGFLVLNAQALERYFKENVRVELFLKRDLKEVDVMQFRKELDTEAYHARDPLRDGGRGGGTAEDRTWARTFSAYWAATRCCLPWNCG